EDAKDRVMMGAERRSMVMSDDEKKLTAYHEAGHAIVALHMPDHDPLHKVTIIPRGQALGVTMSLPERDRLSYTRQYCVSKIAMTFGGREAEIKIFGPDKVTNGATGDIQQATGLARAMIMEWGMSDKLGRVRYAGNEQEVFLGHSVAQTTNMSEETAKLIDDEVRQMVEDGERTAGEILKKYEHELEALAQGLLEYETLTGSEITDVIAGKPPQRDMSDDNDGPTASAVPTAGAVRPSPKPSGDFEPEPA
ncbi:MAG: cell division protein FtsH, partial [Pseudomonadota bacterium]